MILFLLLVFLSSSCVFVNPRRGTYYPSENFPRKWKKDTCFCLNTDISALEEDYHKTKDTFFFDKTIELIDSALKTCLYKPGLVEAKFQMYIMQNKYQQNIIDWFSNIDSSYFVTDFEKIFYVNTLQSLLFNNKGDTIKRDSVNREITAYIEKTVFYGPFDSNWLRCFMQHDREMFTTYCYVRGRYDNIDLLSKELNSCCMGSCCTDSIEIQICKQSLST